MFVARQSSKQRQRRKRRGFEAATTGRLFSDWVTSSQSIDAEIREALPVVRARSRHLCENNDYGKRFLHLLETNVVGPVGIRMQAQAKKKRQKGDKQILDISANQQIEAAWKDWCRKGQCTADRRLTFQDVQRLIIKAVARDGEAVVRILKGFDNPHRFAIQIIESDQLDDRFNDLSKNICMGVERDQWYAPTAYHILQNHPGDYLYSTVRQQKRTRLPAEQIIHLFTTDRANQTRGIPWVHTAAKRLHMLGKYEHTELVSARVGAGKMGFFEKENPGLPYPADDKDEAGNLIEEIEPGKFKALPAGWKFNKFDIDHPNAGFDAFCSAVLRGAASGLNVSYITLANDMAEASYSSMRHGVLEDREAWKLLQGWLIEHFCMPVYEAWLDMAIVSGQLNLPARSIDRWQDVIWLGRRWPWIDPLKEMAANEKAVRLKVKSRKRVASEAGDDIEEVFTEIAQEEQSAVNNSIELEEKPKGTSDGQAADSKNPK